MSMGLTNQTGWVQCMSFLPEMTEDFQQFQLRSTPGHKPAL